MITGRSKLIAHLGVPTETFKSPMIYNPWFEHAGIDVHVVPMGCEADDFAAFLPLVFRLRNILGALITMPHKVAVVALLDEMSPTVRICGSCNAVRKDENGRLIGDMFDGEGFVRGMRRAGRDPSGGSALVVGAGGVGSAIAASLAGAGVARLRLSDIDTPAMERLAGRIRNHFPHIDIATGSPDPKGCDIVVNATPLGMNEADPLPLDPERLDPSAFVGEVVLSAEQTRLLQAARARGCAVQVGTEMLYEQIPAYLEFFGFDAPDAETLRRHSRLTY